tara:strand:+ start:468 stop:845 length:378 start_codon:yes stop_codon:yes gene_type:complete
MKLDEFRKLLKPMIKDMVKQALLEEGLLSNIVSEVAQGLVIAEAKTAAPAARLQEASRPRRNEAIEAARRDLQASKEENKVIYENTRPLPSGDARSALGGIPPDDPGVDISGLLGAVEHKWSKLI